MLLDEHSVSAGWCYLPPARAAFGRTRHAATHDAVRDDRIAA
jgi:hypothetical protein